MDPQVSQCSLQFWDVVWLLPQQLVIYMIKWLIDNIDWLVEVGKIAMPVNGVYVFFFMDSVAWFNSTDDNDPYTSALWPNGYDIRHDNDNDNDNEN